MNTAIQLGKAVQYQGKMMIAGLILGMGGLFATQALALTFKIPANGNIVGSVKTTTVRNGDTLSSIGRRFDIGGYEMKEANPGVPYLFPEPGSRMTIPSQFVLPSGPRQGVVVNLAEMRLYFYHPDGQHVSTYPIGIGKQGWLTPTGNTTIVRKRKNPWWIVPESILNKHARQGKPIEPKMPPGPKNPLGNYAMNLGFKNIVIHGTPFPMGVGIRSSHGCMRMFNRDIEHLFSMVKVGTKVRVVHEPHKVGVSGDHVYLEAHVPLSESIYYNPASIEQLVKKATSRYGLHDARISWKDARKLKQRASGYPQRIGKVY